MNFCTRFILFSILTHFSIYNVCLAQSYGLGFESYEVVQDKRTGLDLSPESTFQFNGNFEVSFEIAFLPGKKTYFGYIVRLIENDTKNIDILYDNSLPKDDHFKVIVGDEFSKIAFDIPGEQLYKKWNKIRLIFNKQKKTITVFSGSKSFTQSLNLDQAGRFKMLFGTNKYKNFNTTDVPPMKIRNIEIREDDRRKYYFPLDEINGNNAPEQLSHANGLIVNPQWIKKMHYDWQPLKTFVVKGPARITSNQAKGLVHIVCNDSLITYSVLSNRADRVAYQSGRQALFMDNQVLYEKSDGKIHNIYINEKQVSSLDLKTGKWNKNLADSSAKTHFLHANKFYSAEDSSIYILGGYGQLQYRGDVHKYNLPTGKWTDLIRKDSVFTPRYLAALGSATDGAYIVGGYGSTTGQQILNPGNWYDLLFFNTKTGTFKKIYNLKIPEEDFVFANSMIINEKAKTFFALIFPKDKFSSQLQLVRGSLTSPEYQVVGSKIPYQFIDTESFADLFYDQETSRFVAVTAFRNEKNQTSISIYSLYAPPLDASTLVKTAEPGPENTIWIVVALIVLAGGFIAYKYKTKNRKRLLARDETVVLKTSAERGAAPAPVVISASELPNSSDMPERMPEAKQVPAHNSIMLFGNLQLFDEQGNEIAKLFTPLLKELFLVILLYSIRRDGISSEKLKELLWFDKPSESARNNRSVNIAKLKGILDKLKYCHISKETGYWKINVDYGQITIDYADYLNLVSDKRILSKQDITELSNITKRGSFLSDLDYEWLDSFKSETSNEIVDAYLRYAASVSISDDPEFLIKLANYIFYFDPVNEEAMTIKCKAFAHLGKHSMAKTTLENFSREYRRIYGEEFQKDMPEVLHS
jgi:DNA-binding SARP family transcriptional activator